MASKKKLSRGLNEIFGENLDEVLTEISSGETGIKASGKTEIDISEIRPNPFQPRKQFDQTSLQELASSIKENGVFQPIIVRKAVKGYELVAGERRLRASKLANLDKIPAIIVDFDTKQMLEISLLENIQREDLSVIELANAYQQLIDKLNYTQEQLANRMGKSRSNITNILRILNLPDDVKDYVNNGKLSYGHARALLALDDKKQISILAKKCIDEGLSVRQLEQLCKKPNKSNNSKTKSVDPFIEDVRNRLQRKYSTRVDIGNKNINIRYNDIEDLNRILEIMGVIED